ncbi:MAG: shikimate dehydrogenase [Verrucomicrobia bacterium]|nr:shikimate dehydrogenase [Verrucomicrobiota bacterium]MDA1088660.1 shikimate dehydrogenase [Verrucomicrobiota bacterium]
MNPIGQTQPFAVLGHPIAHSLSPVMHNAAFAALGLDAVYTLKDVPPVRLMDTLAEMGQKGFVGVNLTVPLKQVAFEGISELDESARLARAVNTVQFIDGGMKGYNTDGSGFLKAYEEAFDRSLAGKRVAILGTGGSARGVGMASASVGASAIRVCGRDAARSEALAAEIRAEFPNLAVTIALTENDGWNAAVSASDAVIHTTTVGMQPEDEAIVPCTAFRSGQSAYDLIYLREETSFMRAASQGGACTANGLGMLLHQGVDALRIWLGQEPPVDVMREALTQAVRAG